MYNNSMDFYAIEELILCVRLSVTLTCHIKVVV